MSFPAHFPEASNLSHPVSSIQRSQVDVKQNRPKLGHVGGVLGLGGAPRKSSNVNFSKLYGDENDEDPTAGTPTLGMTHLPSPRDNLMHSSSQSSSNHGPGTAAFYGISSRLQSGVSSSGSGKLISSSVPPISPSVARSSSSQRSTSATPPNSYRLPPNSLGRLTSFPPSSTGSTAPSNANFYDTGDADFPTLGKGIRRNSQGSVSAGRFPVSHSFSASLASNSGISAAISASSQSTRRPMQSFYAKGRDDEFSMQNEDFPALGGGLTNGFRAGDRGLLADAKSPFPFTGSALSRLPDALPLSGSVPVEPGREVNASRAPTAGIIGQKVKPAGVQSLHSSMSDPLGSLAASGIRTAGDGSVTNVPAGMVTDQFGLIGLLAFIRQADTAPNLVALALGTDLTNLGLCLTSPENLYSSFTSPFSDRPSRPQDIDFPVPEEYEVHTHVGDKLAPIKLHKYSDDLLFYLYYHSCGDVLQLAASAELYQRDWRFHKEEHVWLQRVPGMDPSIKNSTYERGRYSVFEVSAWRKMTREMHIQYDQLEECPRLPPQLNSGPS